MPSEDFSDLIKEFGSKSSSDDFSDLINEFGSKEVEPIKQVVKQAEDKSYKSRILPFSKNKSGEVSFDISAGIPGIITDIGKSTWSGFTYPGDVLKGKASPNETGRVLETATFGLPIAPSIRVGEKIIPGISTTLQRNIPTTTQLEQASKSGYKRVFGDPDVNLPGMDVHYSPEYIKNLSISIDRNLYGRGITPERAPETYELLTKFQNPPNKSTVSLANIHAARQTLSDIALKSEGAEKFAANKFIEKLDDFIEKPSKKGVLAGPATAAGEEYARARGNYAAAKRSNAITGELDQAITGVEERASIGAAAAHSGQNIDNTIRQKVKTFISNPKNIKGFNEEEINALKEVVEGSPSRNAIRTVGNLLGGGLGLGATFLGGAGVSYGISSGSHIATGISASLPVIGSASRRFANELTKKSLAKADAKIRMRSPLFKEGGAGQYVLDPTSKSSVLRSVILGAPETFELKDYSE